MPPDAAPASRHIKRNRFFKNRGFEARGMGESPPGKAATVAEPHESYSVGVGYTLGNQEVDALHDIVPGLGEIRVFIAERLVAARRYAGASAIVWNEHG